jgi:outer membrane protein OmpA-like peptidoglycan-associated protein
MGVLLIAAAVGLAIFFVKPSHQETVVLLPSADGHKGVLVVERKGERYVLDQPYASSETTGGDKMEVKVLSDAQVRDSFASTLTALPARPASFLLYFVTGSDELTEDSKSELQKILDEIKNRPYPDILVIGHTDTVGELEGNDRQSAQRAEPMKSYLIGIGVPQDRIRVAGRGEREPLIPTADNVDEPKNRRVEINVR